MFRSTTNTLSPSQHKHHSTDPQLPLSLSLLAPTHKHTHIGSDQSAMKILGWMHRKFGHNTGDIYKDLTTDSSSNCFRVRLSSVENHDHRYRIPMKNNELFDSNDSEEMFFGGFLTIGTLGTEAVKIDEEVIDIVEDDRTPASEGLETVEAIAEKQTELPTETELMVVGFELEKMMTEVKKIDDILSSGTKFSTAFIPDTKHCSSYKPPRDTFPTGQKKNIFPLQEYLLGSSLEGAKAAELEAPKDRRVSLRDLFMMEQVTMKDKKGVEKEEESVESYSDSRKCKWTDGINLMKRKRGKADVETKAHRERSQWITTVHPILQIFHKKVHPENIIGEQKHRKAKNTIAPHNKCDLNPDNGGGRWDLLSASSSECRKKDIPSFECRSLSGSSDSSGSREHWIKTDSDFLVLEL